MKGASSEKTFKLSKNRIQLWHCRFDRNMRWLPDYKNTLSTAELQKAARFKFGIHRQRYCIGRGILRMLLGRYLNEKPQEVEFDYTEYGKPFLKGESRLQFNLSHSHERAVFAFVLDTEIGVDIEKVKEDFEVLDIAQNFFAPDEIETLEQFPETKRAAGFYRCWTRKESFIKAKGSGLSFSLTSFTVSLDADRAELLRTEWDPAERNEWHLSAFTPEEGYMGALAVRGDGFKIKQMEWDSTLI